MYSNVGLHIVFYLYVFIQWSCPNKEDQKKTTLMGSPSDLAQPVSRQINEANLYLLHRERKA